jgi:hypothetical protein
MQFIRNAIQKISKQQSTQGTWIREEYMKDWGLPQSNAERLLIGYFNKEIKHLKQ